MLRIQPRGRLAQVTTTAVNIVRGLQPQRHGQLLASERRAARIRHHADLAAGLAMVWWFAF